MQTLLDLVFERHPDAAPLAGKIRTAVNQEMAAGDAALSEDDEVALLPPVAGGANILTGLREGGISIQEAMDAVTAPEAGGVVMFVGTVRNHADEWGEVDRLEYSAYREMAESVLRQVAEEAATKWPLHGVAILHGLGDLTDRRPHRGRGLLLGPSGGSVRGCPLRHRRGEGPLPGLEEGEPGGTAPLGGPRGRPAARRRRGSGA